MLALSLASDGTENRMTMWSMVGHHLDVAGHPEFWVVSVNVSRAPVPPGKSRDDSTLPLGAGTATESNDVGRRRGSMRITRPAELSATNWSAEPNSAVESRDARVLSRAHAAQQRQATSAEGSRRAARVMARAVDGDYFQLKVAAAQNRDRDSRYEL